MSIGNVAGLGDRRAVDTRTRILDAVVSWAASTGLRKLAMDEIARRARVGRATLYKHFPGRDALIAAAVQAELGKFFGEAKQVLDEYATLEDRLVHGFAHGYRQLSGHPALWPILELNPELLLPYVITRDSYALDFGRAFVESYIPGDDLRPHARVQLAEHVARTFHTLLLIPTNEFGLDEPDGPEDYARNFLLPVLRHFVATDG